MAYPVDVDSDGDVDILASARDLDTMRLYENDGSESFYHIDVDTNADGVDGVFARLQRPYNER